MEEKRKQNPYKALYSYNEDDEGKFYGRKVETKNLLRLVENNFLTVVFGKSGIGKSSLLNAGIFPQLKKKGFFPILIRLKYESSTPGLLDQVKEHIKKKLEKENIHLTSLIGKNNEKEVIGISQDETIWEYFHRINHISPYTGQIITPVLVLDQFEEIFTLGKHHREINSLLNEIYYLIEDEFPDYIKERLQQEEYQMSYSMDSSRLRMIICLREDYLPHLSELKSHIPSIDRVMFRLIHLNGKQAREIIGMPDGIKDEEVCKNILSSFYPEEVIEGESIPDDKLEIEPSILSLLCFQLFEEIASKKNKLEIIKDQNRILTVFYESVMKDFPGEVEEFIESKLITEGGFRTPFRLEQNHPLKKYCDLLEDRRILRTEYYGEKKYIEIIHDVLSPVIKAKRNQRQEAEKKRQIRKELIKKNYRIIIGILSILIIVFILLAAYAIEQKDFALKERDRASAQEKIAREEGKKAKEQWEIALRETQRANEQADFALNEKKNADRQFKRAMANSLIIEADHTLPQDHTQSIRMAEYSYKLFPQPPSRLIQILIAGSNASLRHPFYKSSMVHEGPVNSSVFSPDEKYILTASGDNAARLWNSNCTFLMKFQHNADVNSAVFSPDGKRILTASVDNAAKLWTLKGNLLVEFKHGSSVNSAIFSPNGLCILTTSNENNDYTAKVWSLNGSFMTESKHGSFINSAVFSPDGTKILTASSDNTAKLFDLKTNHSVLYRHSNIVNSAAFSPDGTRIITASSNKTAVLWDLNGNSKGEFRHLDFINSAVFSPDGTHILTASDDNYAKLWDIEGETSIGIWKVEYKHTEGVKSALFSIDGTRIITISADNSIKLWDIKGTLKAEFKHNDTVNSAVFSKDGNLILTASNDETSKLWDINGTLETEFNHDNSVTSALFSKDGNRIITASLDNTIKLWDIKGRSLAEFKYEKSIKTAMFSPNETQVLTVSNNEKAAKLWDLKGSFITEYKHKLDVNSAVFSPDGSFILTASVDNTAKLWSIGGMLEAEFKHTGYVNSAFFSSDGSRIITASADNTVKLWTLKGIMKSKIEEKSEVKSAVFSPDGTLILIVSLDKNAKLRTINGNLKREFNHLNVSSAIFSPDGSRILTASTDKTVKLWRLNGQLIAEFKHANSVNSAVFSPDGTRILTSLADSNAVMYYTPEGIIQWLKNAPVAKLSLKNKENLGIE